jgi:signal peptidase I
VSQVGTASFSRGAARPLRELRLTLAALGELEALVDPLRPLIASVLFRGRITRTPRAGADGIEGTAGSRAPATATLAPGRPETASAHREETARPANPGFLASLRRPGNLAFFGVLIVVLTAWWVVLRPTSLLGGSATFITVRGTSMLPTLKTGDFVLAEAQPAYKVGDLVVYRVPKGQIGAGDDLIHRIVAGNASVGFTLQGDNNPAPDPWTVPRSDILGKEALVLPGFGNTLLVLRSPLFAGLAAALIAIWVVLSPPEWLGRKRPAVKASAPAAEPASMPATEPASTAPLHLATEASRSTATPAALPHRPPVRRRTPAGTGAGGPLSRAPAPPQPRPRPRAPRPAAPTPREP